MGGSTAMQFLFQSYHDNLAQAVTTHVSAILAAIAATAHGAILLYIIILGKKMMFSSLSWDAGVTKLVRAIVVITLLTAANYQTFIATPVTTTIPDFISNTITGSQGLRGAQGFDALLNQIENFTAQTLAQTVGLSYIGDRVVIWLTGQLAEIVVMGCFFIWMLANATADFLVPLGAVLLPLYLFDATRSFTERWYGKILALFLVMIVTLMLGQIVVFQDAQYMQKFATAIMARPPDSGFNMNPDLNNPGVFTPATAGGETTGTVNVHAAINTLAQIDLVFLFGLFLMVVATAISLFIGGGSGFSAAPAFNAMTRAGGAVLRRR